MNEQSSRSHAIFIITIECSQVFIDMFNFHINSHFFLFLQYSAIQQVFDMTFYDSISICLQLLASVPHNHLLPTYVTSASSSSPPLRLPCIRPSMIIYVEQINSLLTQSSCKKIMNFTYCISLTPDQGARARPQPTIHHHFAVSTNIKDNICEASFSLHSARKLELTTEDSD